MGQQGESGKPRSGGKSCCLLGCLGMAFVGVALLVGGGSWIGGFTAQFAEAEEFKAQRQEAAAAKPFQPAADGRVPPDRLEAYLGVRRAMAGPCAALQGFFGEIQRLEEREAEGDEPGFADGLALAWGGMKVPGMLADFFEARNRVLVEESMSLDEFRWYTVLAYRSGGGTFLPEGVESDRRDARGGAGDHELVRRLLVAQLEAARAAGPEAVGAEWLAMLEAEVVRLDGLERSGWPWAEGLPARVAESFEPAAEELIVTHCLHSEDFEIDEVEQNGMTVRVE